MNGIFTYRVRLIWIILCFFINNTFVYAVKFSDESLKKQISNIIIKDIVIKRHSVFNKKKPLLNKLNKLHILTLETIIKKDLLFKKGDFLNLELLENSERKLRERKYIGMADITVEKLNENKVRITVETTDQWSTMLGFSLKKNDDNKNILKLILKEYNFLGYGKTIKFKKDILFVDKKDHSFSYEDEHFLFEDYLLKYNFSQSSSEINSSTKFGKNFKSDYDKYSYFINFNYNKDSDEKEYIHNNSFEFYMSNSKRIERVELALRFHKFTDEYKTSNLKKNYLFAGVNFSSVKYDSAVFLFKYGVTEDIPIGYNFNIGYKIVNKCFGANVSGHGYESLLSINCKKNNNYFFQRYWFDYLNISDYSENIFKMKLEHYYKIKQNLTWVNIFNFKRKKTYKQVNYYELGESEGLRGYSGSYFEGNKYVLFNSELRYVLKKELLGFFYPGFTFLFDAGRMYNSNEPVKLTGFYSNVGIDISLIMFKTTNFNKFNLVIAKPFRKEKGINVSFNTSLDF